MTRPTPPPQLGGYQPARRPGNNRCAFCAHTSLYRSSNTRSLGYCYAIMALPSNDNVGQMIDAFPYPPYDIQRQLMINIYTALQGRQIGLFESPTGASLGYVGLRASTPLRVTVASPHSSTPYAGTGKTLSVICSVLKWLEDERSLQQARAAAASGMSSICFSSCICW